MRGAVRLANEAFDGDETLGDGIDCQEETLERDGPEQRRSAGGDEAGCGDLLSVQGEADLGDGPGLPSATGGLNGLGARHRELELVGQSAWNDEQRRAGVDQQVERRRPTRGTGEPGGNVVSGWIADVDGDPECAHALTVHLRPSD
jgi:hypothetical protein